MCWTQQNKFLLSRSIPRSHAGHPSIVPKSQGQLLRVTFLAVARTALQGRAVGEPSLSQARGSGRCLTRSVGRGDRPELPSVTAPSGSCDGHRPAPSPGAVQPGGHGWPWACSGSGQRGTRLAGWPQQGMWSPALAEMLSRETVPTGACHCRRSWVPACPAQPVCAAAHCSPFVFPD